MRSFAEALRKAGLKVTHQRTEIFREVARSVGHPDAETVYKRVRHRIPAVSLDTVYRTLSVLEREKLLWRIETSSERARFDANMQRHYHFLCTQCQRIMDFHSDHLDQFRIPAHVRAMGVAQSFHVLVRGICSGCLTGRRSRD
jgi:Fur family peroxide stress response transcriptional regulator